MKTSTGLALLGAISAVSVHAAPVVDESYPYTGPEVPVGDWVDPTINGNGKGFQRLVEAPAVKPATANPSNNVNVISLSFVPKGINIHFQTPFGLGVNPSVKWGKSATNLNSTAVGYSHTYDRTPPCSLAITTQCSQFFHEVEISGLESATTYYYQIPAANGTTTSDVLTFTTAHAAGDSKEFTAIMLNDMGYAAAGGTHQQMIKAIDDGAAFAFHGGDISYADDWFAGILPCSDVWPTCYNGSSSKIPGSYPEDKEEYDTPLPAGEIPNWGGVNGGDMNVIYESNWDLWQQWMTNITSKIPYMVNPGNHEATCTEFDGPGNLLTTYLNNNTPNKTDGKATNYGTGLTYYSCPPSQRNFTAYENRFHMAGEKNNGGVGNMWYSFDYGLVHFISVDAETDYYNSPESPFLADLKGNETKPLKNETHVIDAGPFGKIGNLTDTKSYGQYQWLAADLAKVDRCKTPWIVAMGHRPMYSTLTSTYKAPMRAAFEALMIQNGVDAYLSGHIHWYERMWPITVNGTVDKSAIGDNHTYYSNPGVSMTHIVNGMAGNGESHVIVDGPLANTTAYIDDEHYGFNKLRVMNSTHLSFSFIQGRDGALNDQVTLVKRGSAINSTCSATSTTSGTATSTPSVSTGGGSRVGVTSITSLAVILSLGLCFL